MIENKKNVYVVFYGREIRKERKLVFIDQNIIGATKRKYKFYKTWSGVFKFLLKAPYTEPVPAIARGVWDNDGYKCTTIDVFFKPKVYMNFWDLAQIAGTADTGEYVTPESE